MKITGIGNALLDVLIRLESDKTLRKLGLEKGAMDLIDESKMKEIQGLESRLPRSEAPGGSVSNTMRSLARLGATVGYIGKIGNDKTGEIYEKETAKAGVHTHFVQNEGVSGCSTVLVSPDGERTMATYLGLAATLNDAEITDNMLDGYDCIYVEGYLISNEKLFLPVLQRAKKAGLKIALDLANFNIVNGFRDLLKEVIPEYIDILFSNESEAEAFTGLPAREAIRELLKMVDISVVTIGKDGALAGRGNDVVKVNAHKVNVLDTTGAGDNFAAGFLYGYAQGASTEQSAQIGALLAGNVVETMGAQIESGRWEKINLKVCEILRK
ncbi:MAG: adenosine kinase [Tannerella sp.]|nr:adenosine kinase [Tannerella sp.]